MDDKVLSLSMLLANLGWKEIILVTDSHHEPPLSRSLSDAGVQHVLVTDSEALSGQWVHGVVKTGVDSWTSLHIVMMCSAACVQDALTKASQLEQELGTQTAFAMTSRWLVVTPDADHLVKQLHIANITMDNVAVIDLPLEAFQRGSDKTERTFCNKNKLFTLEWKPRGRQWSTAGVYTTLRSTSTTNKRNLHELFISNHTQWSPHTLDRLLFPNAQHGLNSRCIRVVVKEWQSYVKETVVNGSKVWTGLLVDFLHQASRQLNFTYELVDANDDEWGTGTPSDPDRGFLGRVVRKEVDLALSNYDITWERSLLLDSLSPLIYSSIVMIYRKPQMDDVYRMPLGPLSSAVWIGLTVAFILVCLLLWTVEVVSAGLREKTVLEKTHGVLSLDVNARRALYKLDRVISIAGAAILSEPSESKLTSRGGRVLLWSWWMLSLVVTAAYSGTLTSFLSVNQKSILFSTPKDLLSGSHGYTWGVLKDSVMVQVLETSTDPVYQGLWSGIQRSLVSDPLVLSDNTVALAEKVKLEKFVLFSYHHTSVSMFGQDCDIVIVGAGVKSVQMSLNLPKGSALVKPFDELVLALHSNGLMALWTDQWFHRATCPTSQDLVTMTLRHVEGVMLVLPVGVGLALGVLLLERASIRAHRVVEQDV